MTEIERKFLVGHVPDELGQRVSIRQGYLAVNGQVEVRVRAKGSLHLLTIKGGHGLERSEVEVEITSTDADELFGLCAGRVLHKDRHRVAVGSHTAEVDRYHGSLDGLMVVEVEFADRSAAEGFAPPAWFGREVTDERGWSNAALAAHGRPDVSG